MSSFHKSELIFRARLLARFKISHPLRRVRAFLTRVNLYLKISGAYILVYYQTFQIRITQIFLKSSSQLTALLRIVVHGVCRITLTSLHLPILKLSNKLKLK